MSTVNDASLHACKLWRCNVCQTALFVYYHDALAHEKRCVVVPGKETPPRTSPMMVDLTSPTHELPRLIVGLSSSRKLKSRYVSSSAILTGFARQKTTSPSSSSSGSNIITKRKFDEMMMTEGTTARGQRESPPRRQA